MSDHPTDFVGDVPDAIKRAILEKIPGSVVDAAGGGGHYTISVVSPSFEGQSMVQSQKTVYGAIAHLMKGDRAPVHAVDKLTTRAR
jgi:acid stress-induced BolA-like protein IbaG/YrbA